MQGSKNRAVGQRKRDLRPTNPSTRRGCPVLGPIGDTRPQCRWPRPIGCSLQSTPWTRRKVRGESGLVREQCAITADSRPAAAIARLGGATTAASASGSPSARVRGTISSKNPQKSHRAEHVAEWQAHRRPSQTPDPLAEVPNRASTPTEEPKSVLMGLGVRCGRTLAGLYKVGADGCRTHPPKK